MRWPLLVLLVCSSLALAAASQSTDQDEALLTKVRSLYDAAFTRDLVSFDCKVQFDWKQHFEALVGNDLSPAVIEKVENLQKIEHRVIVNRYGPLVTAKPNPPKGGNSKPADPLDQVFKAMVMQGLDAWLPFSTNSILPLKPTRLQFEFIDTGYKLNITGEGVEATLLLSRDLQMTGGVAQLPKPPTRFTTSFVDGPHGFLLKSMTTGSTDESSGGDTTFAFTYQAVEDFQIPASVSISQSTTKPWNLDLTDCKVVKGVQLQVAPPPG